MKAINATHYENIPARPKKNAPTERLVHAVILRLSHTRACYRRGKAQEKRRPKRPPDRRPRTNAGCPLPADRYHDITDLPADQLDAIQRFLREYSEREGNRIDQLGIASADEAIDLVRKGVKKFDKTSGG